jgi:hypothetical protein
MEQKQKQKMVVLQPSYEDSNSALKDVDSKKNLNAWIDPDKFDVEYLFLKKSDAVQQIVRSKGDVYVNLCGILRQ